MTDLEILEQIVGKLKGLVDLVPKVGCDREAEQTNNDQDDTDQIDRSVDKSGYFGRRLSN